MCQWRRREGTGELRRDNREAFIHIRGTLKFVARLGRVLSRTRQLVCFSGDENLSVGRIPAEMKFIYLG